MQIFCNAVDYRNYFRMLSMTQCTLSIYEECFSTKVTITASFPGQYFDALFCLIPNGRRQGLICCICQTHAGTTDSVHASRKLFPHHCPLLLPLNPFCYTAKRPLSIGSTHFYCVIVVCLWLCTQILSSGCEL